MTFADIQAGDSIFVDAMHLGQLDVTRYGDRADYRSLSMQRVLEISGTEIASELGRRHREKVAQALANPRCVRGRLRFFCETASDPIVLPSLGVVL